MASVIKKGDTIARSTGATYTVTGLLIGKQLVKFDYRATPESPAIPQVVTVAEWRGLQAGEPAAPQTALPGPDDKRRLGPAAGIKFQMMDKSQWEIAAVTEEYLTISNGDQQQTLPVDDYRELLKYRYITVL